MIEVKKKIFIRNSQKNCFDILYVCIFLSKAVRQKMRKKCLFNVGLKQFQTQRRKNLKYNPTI